MLLHRSTRVLSLVFAAGVLAVTCSADGGEIDPKQDSWHKRYKKQKNAPDPATQKINGAPEPDVSTGFTPMFNGKDLSGWTPRGGNCEFAVEGDMIVGKCVPGSPSTYLSTDRDDYTDFIFTCDMNWVVDGNSGVMFRARVKGPEEKQTVYGPQAEMEGITGDRYWSGGIYGQSCGGYFYPLWLTEHEAARGALDRKGWNRLTVQAKGAEVRTWVNGVPCALWIDEQGEYPKGFFGLQVHSGRKGEVQWKNLRIKELK